MPNREELDFAIKDINVQKFISQVNKNIEDFEHKIEGAEGRLRGSIEAFGNKLGQVFSQTQRQANSLAAAYERQAAAFGKSPIEREVQRFEALRRKLGDNEQAINRVTKAHDELLKKMREAEGGGAGGGINARYALFAGKDIVEGRLRNATAEFVNLLSAMKAAPAVIGGAALALIGLGVAGFEATKSLAAYGVEVRDFSLRTGISVTQTEQFRFAAKAAGQDISIFERLMRGLTEAMEDDSKAGQKARDAMARLGVESRDTHGQLRPTTDVLNDIAQKLNALPTSWDRNKVALDIFKRAGIEAIPVVLGLADNLARAKAAGIVGPSEADVAKWDEYNKRIALAGEKWAALWRSIKDVLAGITLATTAAIGGLVDKLTPPSGAQSQYAFDISKNRAVLAAPHDLQQGLLNMLTAPKAPTAEEQGQTVVQSYLSRNAGLEDAQAKLSRLKQTYDEQRTALERLRDTNKLNTDYARQQVDLTEQARRNYEKQDALVKSIQRSETDRRSNAEALQKLLLDFGAKSEAIYGMSPAQKRLQEFRERPGVTPDMVARAEHAPETIAAINREYVAAVTKLQALGREQADKAAVGAGLAKLQPRTAEELTKQEIEHRTAAEKEFTGELERQTKEAEKQLRIETQSITADRAMREAQEESRSKIRASTSLDTTSRTEMKRAADDAEIKKRYLDEQFTYESGLVIARLQFDKDAEVELFELKSKYLKQTSDLQIDLDNKAAEIQGKQIKDLEKTLEKLYNTLFTKPQDFGKQLGQVAREAALKPITEGMASATAAVLHPIIYGSSPGGGIAGGLSSLFQGVTGAPGAPSIVVNGGTPIVQVGGGTAGSAISTATAGGGAVYGGGMMQAGMLMSRLLGPGLMSGGVTGMVGPNLPAFPTTGPNLPSPIPYLSSTYDQNLSGFTESGIGVSPSNAFVARFGGGASGGGSDIATIQALAKLAPSLVSGGSGGTGGFGQLTQMGKNLRSIFSGATISGTATNLGAYVHPQSYTTSALSNLTSGPFSGTAAGGLASTLGLGLATSGLTGNARGSGAGIAEGAIGGFLTAGPIGAAVGAGIGLGEMLAGVQPQWKEAEQLVQQRYHIKIDQPEGQRIADIANQKFGGRVSIAVASPEVRQMLGLYAAGTGQSGASALSSATPHAGSLAEQGGTLYQAATYQYGQAYTYQSRLPVLGNTPSQGWPGGGATNVTLAVNGQSAADLLEGRVANVANPSYVASAFMNSQLGSADRTQISANGQQPGLITS